MSPFFKTKVGLISLGCPKNLVDSEVMLGFLKEQGFMITNDEDQADVLIVNTCAFIDPAKEESVETILEAAKRKKTGQLKKLIVTGCLAQRYKGQLHKEFPEVDHFLGTGEVPRIAQFVDPAAKTLPVMAVGKPEFLYDYATPRVSSLPPHTAYIKVSEGCSRRCSFCVIPRLRGRARSRSVESIVTEAQGLVENGALELNLIAQDLTAYGQDLKNGTTLEKLLSEMVEIKGLRWIRLLYTYPQRFSDALIEQIAGNEKIASYLDIPLQHIDDTVLAAMKRDTDERSIRELLKKLKSRITDLTLRTTLITGFPGETEKAFSRLLSFVQETGFDRLGVFPYSQEEGTLSAKLPKQVPASQRKERAAIIMEAQREISARKNASLVGCTMDVLIDASCGKKAPAPFVGRTQGQALEIDGSTFVQGQAVQVGSMVKAKINDASDYDLFGCVV